jgi:hypothetical protein
MHWSEKIASLRWLWKTGRGLCRQPVRLRDLGRAFDIPVVLQRRQAAARKLRGKLMSARHIQNDTAVTTAEPLLPVEKKLIGFSLGIGLALLVVLVAINHLFPVKF